MWSIFFNSKIYLNLLNIEHIPDLEIALNWCDVVNVLRIQLERQDVQYIPSLREYAMTYGVNKNILSIFQKE